MEDKRIFQRVLFNHNAKLINNDQSLITQVLDLSFHGFLCTKPANSTIQLNDEFTLELQLDKDIKIVMQSTVVHIEASHMGMHCSQLDVDSISELKRLIQLNLANDDLLNRELSHLVR